MLGQMRGFNAAPIRTAPPEPLRHPNHLLLYGVILHNADGTRLLILCAGFPLQGYHIFFPVIIMEKRCVKASRVDIDRLAPKTAGIRGGDEVVVHIEVAGVHGVPHAIQHIEQVLFFAVGQAGGPDTLGRRKFLQVRIICVLQCMGV